MGGITRRTRDDKNEVAMQKTIINASEQIINEYIKSDMDGESVFQID